MVSHDYLKKASKAYYEGSPIISDTEFDYLASVSGYNDVGYNVEDAVKHLHRMYSLEKAYVGDSKFPLDSYTGYVYKSPKLDGAAIALVYMPDGTGNSVLVSALSRGDGVRGKNILNNLSCKVPPSIPCDLAVQINCEVVAPKTVSDNPRNYAAGALGLKNSAEFSERELTVVALDAKHLFTDTYEETLEKLESFGFVTTASKNFSVSLYPTDGVVYRINSNEDYEKAGSTTKFPKGAFALKRQAEGVWTKLKSVEWNVGRSGVVTPVANLEPVNIDGATVSKATLHNMAHINTKLEGLKTGDEVLVIRSGEIIPKIIARRNCE